MAAGSWKDVVLREVHHLVRQQGAARFTRADLLAHAAAFRTRSPTAKTPNQTVSRVLQELRDLGILQFVEPGVYELLDDSPDALTFRHKVLRGRGQEDAGTLIAERLALVKRRRFQRHFRSYVRRNFQDQCAACGIAPEWLLEAAHLRPVAQLGALANHPGSGVLLCRNHHAALDRGWVVIDEDWRFQLVERKAAPPSPTYAAAFTALRGRRLRTPVQVPILSEVLPSVPAHRLAANAVTDGPP